MVRLLNNKMNVSRNTVYNGFVKGSKYLNKVLPILKEKLLAKGAVVNCDDKSLVERTLRSMTVELKRSNLSRLLGRKNMLPMIIGIK